MTSTASAAYGGPYPDDEDSYINKMIHYNDTLTYTSLDTFKIKSQIPIDCLFYQNNTLVFTCSNVTKCIYNTLSCSSENYTIFISTSEISVQYFNVEYLAYYGSCLFIIFLIPMMFGPIVFVVILIAVLCCCGKSKSPENTKLLKSPLPI